jgi:lactose/L-arabinose transport system substrate-binding protein
MKKLLSYLLVFSLSFGVSACKYDEDKNEVSEKQALKGSIEIWTAGVSGSLIDFHLKKFKENNEQVTVKNTFIDEDKLNDKILESLISAKPLPDIYLFSGKAAEEIKAYKSHFSDLGTESEVLQDKYINSNFTPIVTESNIIGIPWTVQPVVMFYRTDLFDKYGIKVEDIRTWEDYILAGTAVQVKTKGKVKMLPININSQEKFADLIHNEFIGTNSDLNLQPDSIMDNEVKALDVVNRMKEANILYDVKDLEQVVSAVEKNEVLSVISSSDFIGTMKEKLKAQSGKWSISDIPSFETGGNTAVIEQSSYIALDKEAIDNKIVMEFLQSIVNDKELEKFLIVEKGIFPGGSHLYNEAFMDEKDVYFNNVKVWRFLAEIIKDAPYYSVEVKGVQEENK